MTREEIEKAAFYSIDAPCVRDCDKCNDKYKNDCMWSIYRDGFVAGAKWLADKLCIIPWDKALKELHDYCMEKEGEQYEGAR